MAVLPCSCLKLVSHDSLTGSLCPFGASEKGYPVSTTESAQILTEELFGSIHSSCSDLMSLIASDPMMPPEEATPSLASSTETHSSESDKENSARSSPVLGRAGSVSPSTLLLQRKLSSVIISSPEAQAPNSAIMSGRPTTVIQPTLEPPPRLVRSTTTAATICAKVATTNHGSRPTCVDIPATAMRKPDFRRLQSAPAEFVEKRVLNEPAPLRLEAWAEPSAASFRIRGPTYLQDGEKVPSEGSAFHLLTVDLVKSDEPIFGGLCSHPNERIQRALRREQETGIRELPDYIYAVNLAIPGPPCYHIVFYYGIDDIDSINSTSTPFGRVARKFFFGDSDKFRDETWKLIPRIKDGNFVVKKAVGSKPSILGKKLRQIYIKDDRFFEMIVDIGSDSIAQKIVKLSTGYAKTLVVDMAFVLEGRQEETLPEVVMGCVRLKNIDFKKKDGQRKVVALHDDRTVPYL